MSHYLPYPEYRDSGIKGIAKIPEHWIIGKLKYNTTIYNGNSISDNQKSKYEHQKKDISIPYISTKNLESKYFTIEYNSGLRIPIDNKSDFKIAKTSSTIICIEGGSAGKKIAYLDKNVCFVNKLACIESHENQNAKYTNYFIHSSAFKYSFKLLTTGLIPGVSISQLKNITSLHPPIGEQEVIAKFLDIQTLKIDTLIEKKQEMIKLLKEKKQSMISNAVTKGLNPNVKYKDSRVEWIGNVPEHWEVKRLASFGKFTKGGGFSKKDLTENGIPAILYGDIYTKYNIQIEKIYRFISKETAKDSIKINKGDLLFTGSGETIEDIGKCIVYLDNKIICAGGDVIIYRQHTENSLFLSYSLNTDRISTQKAMYAKGQIIVHIYASGLREIFLALPPKKEQDKIANFLDTQTLKIDKIIKKTEKAIALLKEKRTALISAAVTGKIDIREIA